ncbi:MULTISPECIES: hypothetical protein [Roseomonadaceae]|uniref:Uncharacterized protein n=1 Tax=Falsiroseomonas oleicola TaxID=2801474 RepID=A0ABS6H8F3_9PROT|nr:hypothetical protein [Roseomonas oleicola]MBU8543998.1 hypothetical protein [Roseomonas oleicola]
MMARIRATMTVSGMSASTAIEAQGRRQLAAIEAGMEGVTEGVLLDLRQNIRDAFPRSSRLPTTITGEARGAERGLPPAALIYPRRGANVAELLESHTGATITPRGGKALAIPLRGVPRIGYQRRRQMTPEQYRATFGRDSLHFVPARPGSKALGYLAATRKAGRDFTRGKPGTRRSGRQPKRYDLLFVLVRAVVLPARLKPLPIIEKWVELAPVYIERAAALIGE